jgi:hypothetical protein
MSSRWSVSVAACLLLALAGAIACGGWNSGATPTAPSPTAKSTQTANAVNAIAVEPVALRPEFLPGAACAGYRPFGMHLNVIVIPSPYRRYVNAISFAYLDRRGVHGVPIAIPGAVQGGITSTGIPSNGPIPVPGEISSIFFVYPSSRAVVPYSIRFDCGYAPLGLLSIGLDSIDQFGRASRAQVTVNVGQ